MRAPRPLPLLAAALLAAAALLPRPASASAKDDAALARAVEDQLRLSPVVGRLPIAAAARDGRVVLSGRVDTLYEAWEAVDRAGKARGAIDVEGRLAIGGGERADGAVESAIRRRFSDLPEVLGAGIAVSVREGVATLTGTLRDARVRFQAADAAARVEGVAEVVDRIDTGERDDETLLASVEALVGRRSLSRVSGVFEVRVEAGVVTLEGTVSRFSEKRRAERLVLGINGVREFVDLLSVVPASPDLEIPLR